MKKKLILPTIIAIALIGGLISQVNALTQNKSLATPAVIDEIATPAVEPTNEPTNSADSSNKPSEEPSAEPSPKPSAKPSPKPTKPPVKEVEKPTAEATLSSLLANHLPSKTIKTNADGLAVVTNASSTFVLVNKKRNLPSTYIPKDLVVPDVPFSFSGDSPKKQMRKEAAKALEALFDAAEDDGIKIKAVSGYRSYATQKSIFESNAKLKGEEVANRTSARPGQSEHQTGLAMDISSASVKYGLEESFGDTKEGKWLFNHAAEHGFIIRYLKGKEDITGYSYEPWHVRYVGKEAAKDITEEKVTLEQYFEAVAVSLEK
jgi:D-alanyl-D-alanine carboxypeptidase